MENNVTDALMKKLDALSQRAEATPEIALKGSGGGGNNGGMEARIAKLEGQFEKLNEKVDQLRIDSAVLKEKVSNLPSKGFIVTATVTALAFFAALMLFKEKIVLLLG